MTNIPLNMEQYERPDPILTNKIVTQLKSQGIFDEFRRECMADVDTRPAYQNLRQRVEGSVAAFLKMNPWRPDMNKNQLRDNLRKHIQSGGFLDIGVDRIVDQVVNPKIYSVFLPKVEEVVQNCLGLNKDKPKFDPSPQSNLKPEPPKFQNKHNLAPRAALTAARMPSVPTTETLKPLELAEEGNSLTAEEPAHESFVMDEEEAEEDEADDDEESPPFEPHSESDRLILGVRSDSSDSNSNDNRVVTTIVDDNLEERIDNDDEDEAAIKDEKEEKEDIKKEDGFSSDDSVPKTPTINMEGSDGTLIEFETISEYRQYQNKFDDESLDNVEEEVISSQWADESGYVVKEERSSNEEDSGGVSQKRKKIFESFDDKSSSCFSSCDEGKSDSFSSSTPKKVKLEDDSETVSELVMNDDSNTDKSLDAIDVKCKQSSSEHRDRSKTSSSSSKEGKSHRHHHSHKEQKEHSSHHRSSLKGKHAHKEHSGNLSRDKSDNYPKDDKEDISKEQSKEREKMKSEYLSSKQHNRDSRSEPSDKDKERKESRHEHRDKSRDYHDKEKKKPDSHDKHLDGKREHEPSNKHSSDKRDSSKSSKHDHSSSKQGNRSSSEKHRSDKHKSHGKKSEKDSKHETKKKQREYCKSSNKDFEGRRSSDRDSNGPSSRNHFSSSNTSKSVSSRNNLETTFHSSDKTTSNSDNTVSDHIEHLHDDGSKFDSISEQGIASPDPEITEESWNESESDFHESKEFCDQDIPNIDSQSFAVQNLRNTKPNTIDLITDHNNISNCCVSFDKTARPQSIKLENPIENDENSTRKYDTFQNLKETVCDKDNYTNDEQDFATPASSVHDTSSEKENIDFPINYKESENMAPEVFPNTDDKVVKFKKPKIAANIFEVRKIMQERRHLKRMEKKRIKLLMKTNTQDCPAPESSPEMNIEEQDVFLGFDDVSLNKIEKYDCLISRLNNEVSAIGNFEINPIFTISLIEENLDPEEYIENVAKGKDHRNAQVRLSPNCEDFYKYDAEQNADILVQNPDELVNSNLTPSLEPQEVCRQNHNKSHILDENCSKSRHNVCKGITSPKRDQENQNFILQASLDNDDSKTPTSMINNNTLGVSKEELDVLNNVEDLKSTKVSDEIASIGITSSNFIDVQSPQKLMFSLTFNQTYDEILKEKERNSENVSNQLEGKSHQRGSTVIKITNNKTTEQVIMKTVEFNFQNKPQVPKITRSESVVNGKLTTSTPQQRQLPLISRINKSNNVVLAPSSSAKSRRVNGIASPESTNFEAEVALPDNISPKIISDMIGIDGNVSDQRSSDGETCLRQRSSDGETCLRQRSAKDGLRQHQRYSNSDLYKPRPRLTSRRVRGQSSEAEAPSPAVTTRKRAAATPQAAATTPKRRR